jgi:hypothetical protein
MIVCSPRPEVNVCFFIQTEGLFACLCVHEIGKVDYHLIAGIVCCDIDRARDEAWCHGRISGVRAGVGIVARRIRYRAIYVQKSNPVVDSIDRM